MKAADLERARQIADSRRKNAGMRDRLASGEGLSLLIGEGSGQSGIVLSANYVAGIRADLVAAFDKRVADDEAALVAMGVQP